MKNAKWICGLFISCCMIFGLTIQVQAWETAKQRTVRVGFFSSDGYHMIDNEGTMSGYGYDFLQMMLRYNNWNYEYVGYDKNWGDMLDMLYRGEIDMVTLANISPARLEEFDFSEKSIGTSSTIMTISEKNTSIIPGEYDTYEGTQVGLVTGSSHNERFEEYADTLGFTYEPVYYERISDLLSDLRTGNHIDIAVTSNMRQLSGEVVLDEFNATEYYVVVKKGNKELLNEINKGIEQLNVYTPDWRTSLFQKYYADINFNVISYTAEERQYLKYLNESGKVIKAAMNPELKPYSYFEDGEAKGIVPKVFREISNRVGIQYEIIPSDTRWEYKEQLNSGEVDIDLTAYLDYGLAEKFNLKETDAYINSSMAMLSRKDSNTDQDTMTVAVVRYPTEYMGYNEELIYPYDYREYESIQECIDAVKNGEVDATFQYVYIAEQAVLEDYTNRLQYTILPDHTFGLAIGVKNSEDHRLLSILNKGVNSIPISLTQGIMLEESNNIKQQISLLAVAYAHPLLMIFVIVLSILIFFVLLLLIIMNHMQKNKLLASAEMGRFIGYVCESYENVVEVNLTEKQKTTYHMEDNALVEEREVYNSFDRSYFEKIVHQEDIEKMTKAFSDATIDQMIREGGSEQYLECQVRDAAGNYQWYSYIIKAVPKDIRHPRNFVVFKKNIHQSKVDEEEQKQVLRDALEATKSASAAKGQFLSKMSHEIRTPLNAVIGYMNIAKDSGDDVSKVMHCVENSDMAAKHLLNIINDVLDISSIENGKMKIAHEEFDLKSQIISISKIFFYQAKKKDVKFQVFLNSVIEEWVIGDSLRVNQILMNLLSNALKFTPEGGKVTLSVTQVDVYEKKIFMKFAVQDTGIGMSEEYQKRLFQPFEQESAQTAQRYGGSGLGLSITYNLIQMMGGSIEVTSEQEKGSTFVVSLHFDRCLREQRKMEELRNFAHVRALIVEENKESYEYICSLLKRCKIKNDVVTSREAAIRQLKRRMESEYMYNMCIMEWDMFSQDGEAFMDEIKELCGVKMPMIVMMAYDVTECEERAKQMGVNRVIEKPLFQSTLFDLLVSTYGKYEPVSQKEKKLADMRGLHVLLAEDNPMNMEIAMDILNKTGMMVDGVSDGKQAYEKFTGEPEGTYDAILMDVQMPVMNGYQATGAIRKSEHPEAGTIPIIAMTANAFAEDVNAAIASGMNSHIAKPVDYDKLYEVLNQFCKKIKS